MPLPATILEKCSIKGKEGGAWGSESEDQALDRKKKEYWGRKGR